MWTVSVGHAGDKNDAHRSKMTGLCPPGMPVPTVDEIDDPSYDPRPSKRCVHEAVPLLSLLSSFVLDLDAAGLGPTLTTLNSQVCTPVRTLVPLYCSIAVLFVMYLSPVQVTVIRQQTAVVTRANAIAASAGETAEATAARTGAAVGAVVMSVVAAVVTDHRHGGGMTTVGAVASATGRAIGIRLRGIGAEGSICATSSNHPIITCVLCRSQLHVTAPRVSFPFCRNGVKDRPPGSCRGSYRGYLTRHRLGWDDFEPPRAIQGRQNDHWWCVPSAAHSVLPQLLVAHCANKSLLSQD